MKIFVSYVRGLATPVRDCEIVAVQQLANVRGTELSRVYAAEGAEGLLNSSILTVKV